MEAGGGPVGEEGLWCISAFAGYPILVYAYDHVLACTRARTDCMRGPVPVPVRIRVHAHLHVRKDISLAAMEVCVLMWCGIESSLAAMEECVLMWCTPGIAGQSLHLPLELFTHLSAGEQLCYHLRNHLRPRHPAPCSPTPHHTSTNRAHAHECMQVCVCMCV